ncbi:hypothetical protein RRG08_048367 [Elysia crispata]|uniref:Protein amnionless n=1 Tax=Elysia crispata TaxID=231223 RepID=A0AAE1ECM1_9GAST|nr:hypothetical protein RRG08_048367 [Elysia crispata]
MAKVTLFCIYVFFFAHSEALYKRWLPNTDFGNSENWNAGRAPCGNDVVIIPDESPVVYVQTNTTMKELVLPASGEIILGRSVALGFTSAPTNCSMDPTGDVEFIATDPASWMDTDNWCSTATELGACDKTYRLDVEQVPCKYDDVVFARNHGYFVDLSNNVPNMAIKSLKISGSSFTTKTFSTFLNQTEGKLMFHVGANSGTLQVTRKSCASKAGCACGNDRPEISEKICAGLRDSCNRPRCPTSVMPVGMCCRLCGAYFNLTKGYGFDLDHLKSTLSKEFLNNQAKQAGIHTDWDDQKASEHLDWDDQKASGHSDWDEQKASGHSDWDDQKASGHSDWDDQKASGHSDWDDQKASGHSDWDDQKASGHSDWDDQKASGHSDWDDQKASGHSDWDDQKASGHSDWDDQKASGHSDWDDQKASGHSDWDDQKASGHSDWDDQKASGHSDWDDQKASGHSDWDDQKASGHFCSDLNNREK